jgi:hypothetical protein
MAAHTALTQGGAMLRRTRSDLEALYQQDNPEWDNALRGAEELYLDRLEEELHIGEAVSALISFNSGYRDIRGRTQFRAALLVVTSQRVLHMAGKIRFLSHLQSPQDQAGSSDILEVASIPYDELAGVTGRRTILSLGGERELYLDRKNGSFVKIRGLTVKQSVLAEERIQEALILH